MTESQKLKTKIRIWVILFVIGLILSGLTAFPLVWELKILNSLVGTGTFMDNIFPDLSAFITMIHTGLIEIQAEKPWIFYGTDWLAFGHIIIGVAFIGPLMDPVRNKWIINVGIIACIAVLPLAFICGPIRGIPIFWRLIDCSFGVFGIIPLLICRNYINRLEKMT